jgi:ergothioneine biosynthesis protein EgtB
MQYRKHVTTRMVNLLQDCDDDLFEKFAASLVLGLNHEQQHQELIMTDISHALLHRNSTPDESVSWQSTPSHSIESKSANETWLNLEGGEVITGYQGQGFCFDNELAAHPVLLLPFQIASQPVSNAQWIEFIVEGGYEDPMLWLADGWAWMCENNIHCPLYWYQAGGNWKRVTLAGATPVPPDEPVSHVSYYEADAFASWREARLPRENEWEHAARMYGWDSNSGETNTLIKASSNGNAPLSNALLCLGQNWEWTQSAYSAYPGFRVTPGNASEYNGKFMVNQLVLRGASRATSPLHSRPSYRNFFYPGARWQFSSVRLANDPV